MKILLISLLSLNLFAIETEKLQSLYEKTDKSFDLECFYFAPLKNLLITPVNKTTYINKTVVRDFNLKNEGSTTELRVKIFQASQSELNTGKYPALAKYEVELNDKVYKGSITDNYFKGFYLNSSFDEQDSSYEVNSLYCRLGLARTLPYEVSPSTSDIHINVHPHSNYDRFNETTKKAQEIIDSNKRKNVILIEEQDDVKGAHVNLNTFLETGVVPELPINIYKSSLKVGPEDELVVSPAGHNRYEFSKKSGELNVLYTGGFHNYCVWNNARNLLTSFFRSESESKVVINYKLDAMIVQRLGVIDQLSFSLMMRRTLNKKTRLLANLVNSHPKVMTKYFRNYFNFFSGPFLKKNKMGGFMSSFKTLKIKYNSPLYKNEKIIEGQGTRDLEIEFNYL
jgi:hypothetical protein